MSSLRPVYFQVPVNEKLEVEPPVCNHFNAGCFEFKYCGLDLVLCVSCFNFWRRELIKARGKS